MKESPITEPPLKKSSDSATKGKDWQFLTELCALEQDDATSVVFGKLTLAVYDTREGIFVSDARCTHAGANLCDGYFNGKFIECPLHQGLFDATNGRAVAAPVSRNLRMYETRIEDGKLYILI